MNGIRKSIIKSEYMFCKFIVDYLHLFDFKPSNLSYIIVRFVNNVEDELKLIEKMLVSDNLRSRFFEEIYPILINRNTSNIIKINEYTLLHEL